ncbi:MAG: hypothetical protein ACRDSP_23220 [Pseudonocardiaceae bacterium]
MAREDRGDSLRSGRFPILVVEGFRGTGKTALLSELVELLDQRVPHARLDLEVSRHAAVPQVLSALAFELSRRCPRYGALQFPRLIIGQLVMSLELDLTDHTEACKQVTNALARHREADKFRDVLVETAGGVLATMGRGTGLPIEPPAKYMFSLLLDQLTAWAPGRRVFLGSFQRWYGHRDLGLTHDSVDVLVDLNRWATDSDDEGNRQRIDELLWAAFLADLRAEFDRGRRADERSLNCVVLLDNADTMLGRRFLSELVRARRQRVAGGQDDADPLTVVATSRGALLSDIATAEHVLVAQDSPGVAGQLSYSADRPHPWWLRYRLPDLTEDEVGRAVAALALDRANNQRLALVVYQMTGGHPASTRLLLDAIAERPPENRIEPEVILSQAPIRSGPPHLTSVLDQVLGRLLVGVPNVALRDLVTCAAARERRHALSLTVQDDLLSGGQANYVEVLDPILWPAEIDGAAGPTLLRRLLRRRLALRDSADPSNWSSVYRRLRETCRAEGDENGELYYALAEGELGFVTRRLHERLGELEITSWFELLESVAAAPHQHRRREASIDEVRALVRAAGLEQPMISLGRLIAALRIAADPFSDSQRRNLHLQIAADCTYVARSSPSGLSAVLLQAAHNHQRQAEMWD